MLCENPITSFQFVDFQASLGQKSMTKDNDKKKELAKYNKKLKKMSSNTHIITHKGSRKQALPKKKTCNNLLGVFTPVKDYFKRYNLLLA